MWDNSNAHDDWDDGCFSTPDSEEKKTPTTPNERADAIKDKYVVDWAVEKETTITWNQVAVTIQTSDWKEITYHSSN